MNNRSLALYFVDGTKEKISSGPVARIYIKTSTGWGGRPSQYITQDCMTSTELDFQINRLIEELKAIQSSAHAKFSLTHI